MNYTMRNNRIRYVMALGVPNGIRIVSKCCGADSVPTFPYQSHWSTTLEKSTPVFFTCQKCGKRGDNKLIFVGTQEGFLCRK